MATATKKFPPESSPHPRAPGTRAVASGVRSVRTHDRRDLSLPGLAETGGGLDLPPGGDAGLRDVFRVVVWRGAAQQYIYRSPGFAILLAFLGMNILCAALIRYPWKKRQTGFVVTHAGLLTLLLGSYYSVRTADEGQVGMLEGDVKSELVRIDYPVIRVLGDRSSHPGANPRIRSAVSSWPVRVGAGQAAIPAVFRSGRFRWSRSGCWVHRRPTEEVLSKPGDPFQFVVKEHLPASVPAVAHVADPDGAPMVRMGLQFKGPGMPQAQDAFRSEQDHWFATEKKFYRIVRSQPPALLAFSYVDRPELVDDFLKPPADPGTKGVARFRYQDRSGKTRVFDWALDGQEGKSVALPESDLTVTLSRSGRVSDVRHRARAVLGEDSIPIAVFKIQSGKDEPVTHMALANLPMVPNVIPPVGPGRQKPRRVRWRRSTTWWPRRSTPRLNGRFGQIEVLAGPDEVALLPRVRPGQGRQVGELRAAGPLAKDKPIVAFGGNANMPMTITFEVDQYLPAAIEKSIFEPIVLPKGQMGNGIAACRAEMTVDGQTKEVWLSRSENLDPPPPRTVRVSRRGLPGRLRRRSQAAGLRAQARRLRHRLRARHRAGDPLREQGPPDRQVGGHHRPAAQDLDEPPARPSRLHVLPVELYPRARPAHRPVHGAVSVGLPGGHQPRPADHLQRLLAGGAGRIPSVLHAGGNLHRRRQARTRASRHRRQEESRAGHRRRKNSRSWQPRACRSESSSRRCGTSLGEPNMKRISKRLGGLALAGMLAAVLPARGADEAASPGAGPAYELIGKVAVMHEGRVKPLDTVAREEVKQIYSRETIKLHDPNEEIEKILDPESHARKAALGLDGRKVGARRGLPRLDRQPRILGRPAVHPGRLSPVATADRRGNARDPAQGDRRQVDDPRRREGHARRSWPPTRSRPPGRSRRTCAAPSCRSKTRRPSPRSPPS